jgi:hypothetical protein
MDQRYWKLVDTGYELSAQPGSRFFNLEVHAKKVDELGGNWKTGQFEKFVTERLKERGLCPNGWEHRQCSGISCSYGTRYSVVIVGQCTGA